MASTLKDFFNSAIERGKNAAQGAYDWMSNRSAGLRGAATPGADPYAEYGPRPNTATQASGLGEPPAANAAGQRPAWGEGMSPEAKAYQASRQAPSSPLPRETGLRARAGGLLRGSLAGAAAYGGVSAAVDAYKNGNTDADYKTADTTAGKLLTGGPAALLSDDFAHATSPIRAGMVGAGRRFLSALNPFGGSDAQATTPQQPALPGPQAAQPNNDLVDTIRGGKVTPEALIGGSEVPAYGQGAFKVGDQPARKVGYEQPAAAGQPGAPAPRAQPVRLAGPTQPGVFGEIAYGQGLRTQIAGERMARQDANTDARLGLAARGQDITARGQDISAETASQRLRYELGKDNRTNFDKLIDNHAQAEVPATTSILPGGGAQKDRDAAVKQYGADLKGRIEYSLGDRRDGRRMEQLAPVEQNQLFLADSFRRKVVDSRGEVVQSFRDLFGNKRFDSRNLYSYMPTKAEPAIDGGYLIHFANGNTANARLVGGQFKLFGPNGEVDTDLQQFIAPLIRKARGQ